MKREGGQALVEAALTMTLVAVLGLMVVEAGRALLYENLLVQASREGARRAITPTLGPVKLVDLPDVAIAAMKPFVEANPILRSRQVVLSARIEEQGDIVLIHARATRAFDPVTRLESAPLLAGETVMEVR